MNISEIVKDINDINRIIQSTQKIPIISRVDGKFIPKGKVEEVQREPLYKILPFLQELLDNKKKEQSMYTDEYISKINEREVYAKAQLKDIQKTMENLDHEKIEQVKELNTKIKLFKSKNKDFNVEKIHINRDQSLKILKYIYDIEIMNEHPNLADFLKRKLVFEIEEPPEEQMAILRKIRNFLQ